MQAFLRNRSHNSLLAVLVALALILPALAGGQAYFGTVTGELTDATGAMVQGAKVVLTDQQKGFTFTATSDNNGRYLFRSIPPGLYSVTVEAQGFQKAQSARFTVDVNQNATANLSLKVAGTTQTVEVGAQAQAIQTEDAETGQVVNRRFINNLPLIDRNVVDLTSLAPGVTEMDDQCGAGCTGTNFVSNGSRGSTADILTDGASVTNSEPNGGITMATYLPSPEAVEEFKVEQTNFSAEYGFSGGSVVNMVTRSGTNKFHGSAYDFVRDQSMDANTWFNDYYAALNGTPQPKGDLRRNNYGGTFGGPIIKGKTFFFFDYDASRQTGQDSRTAGVPTDIERTGDFGELCGQWGGTFDSSGRCSVVQGQIFDPYLRYFDSSSNGAWTYDGPTGNQFIPFNNLATYASPGCDDALLFARTQPQGLGRHCPPANLQPAPGVAGNLIDPVALTMLSYLPKPNISGGSLFKNWYGAAPTHSSNRQFDIKIDHRFSQNDLLSGKFSYQYNSGKGLNCFKNFTDPCQPGTSWANAHLFALTETHTFNPTLLMNVTLGFTRGVWHNISYNAQGVSDPLGTLGFPSYLDTEGFKGVPAIWLSSQYDSAGGCCSPYQGSDPYQNMLLGQDTGTLTATLDKIHGAHDVKFGFDGRIHQINYIQTNAPNGSFTFVENGTSACPNDVVNCGGDSLASFLVGNMTSDSNYQIQYRPATTNYQYGFFVQDNWKATRKLTLNLGLRYDVTLPRTDRYNRQDYFDPNVASPLNGGSITYTDPVTNDPVTIPLKGGEVFATSSHRKNYVTDWHDIQPRFGFAYQFADKMVARGGYGIYYGQSRSGVTGVVPYGSAGFNRGTNVIPTYNNQGDTPYLHLSNPFPNGLNLPAGNTLGLMNDVGFGANGPLYTLAANRTPNEQSWSFGIERQLPSNIVINAEYIGKKGTHLPFSGTSYVFDHLGSWIESLPLDEANPNNPVCTTLTIACLNNPLPNNPFAGIITNPNSGLSSQVSYAQMLLPYPQFDGVTTDSLLIGSSIFHSLQLSAEKHYSNGLQFLATFAWSKSIDNSSNADDNVTWLGSFSSLQDPNKPWLERSLSTFDIPYVVQFSYSYDLPFGRGRMLLSNLPRWANGIVGGWKTNGIWRIADGRPLSIGLLNSTSLPTYGTQRPNLVGKPRRNHGSDWVFNYFADNNVWQQPDPYALGNSPRTYGGVRSPWSFTSDLSLGKQFTIREEKNLEFRIEAQNAFNHPVFGTPDTTLGDDTFGQIGYTSGNGARQVQLAVKFNF